MGEACGHYDRAELVNRHLVTGTAVSRARTVALWLLADARVATLAAIMLRR